MYSLGQLPGRTDASSLRALFNETHSRQAAVLKEQATVSNLRTLFLDLDLLFFFISEASLTVGTIPNMDIAPTLERKIYPRPPFSTILTGKMTFINVKYKVHTQLDETCMLSTILRSDRWLLSTPLQIHITGETGILKASQSIARALRARWDRQ
jgi:hypothetical protein